MDKMNKKFKSIIKGFALLSIVGFLSSCGGGGGGSSSTTTTPTTPTSTSTISGTAASRPEAFGKPF